ncbi:CHAD domain-containing protein [Paraburkholderia adhaesiva]|uniref:CHAD domain-containing protein n=1 Tax=Paraburkholderia adhaesiva TaxID=2883244 RepID=UPI001F2F1D7E|nr:CHAD domain-containing protein [Paraburkholderia adhaesiva]
MVRVLEIALEIVLPVSRDGTADIRPPRDRTATALAKTLADALPQLIAASCENERVTTITFDQDARLTRAGWRVAVETRRDRQQVVVSNRQRCTPGITALTSIFEAPLDASGFATSLFDAAPEPFREVLAVAGVPVPVAELHGEHSCWRWTRDGIDVELMLDAGLHDPNHAGDEIPSLNELRVRAPWPEGTDDAPVVDALFACAHDLVDALSPSLRAFVRMADALERTADRRERGLAGDDEAVRAEPVDLVGVSTADAALVVIGRNISTQWFGNDASVRDSARTEFIHQMRVAQRRLSTAMRIFSHWQDETWAERIKPDLKWLGGLLGDARDLDVFVESTLPALAAADTDAARWDAVREEAETARRAARERVREALASPRYAHVALAWLQWLAALARRTRAGGENARPLHAHAARRVRRYYSRLAGTQKLTAIDESSRHRARINAKYLRYTLEFFESTTSRRTRTETVRTLTRLQTVLGDGNDAAVALRFLQMIEVEPYQIGFARGWCEAVKRYTAREGERLLRELHKPKVSGG